MDETHSGSPYPNGEEQDEDAQVPRTDKEQAHVGEPSHVTVVDRLIELELANKKLSNEKESLEHQLMHVLERFASTNSPAPKITREEVRDIIRQTIDELSVQLTRPSCPTKAPLARPDYSGFRGSLVESVGSMSQHEYSSLSDAYENLCLNKDAVQQMITSESSQQSSGRLIPSEHPDHDSQHHSCQPKRKTSESLASFSNSTRYRKGKILNKGSPFQSRFRAMGTHSAGPSTNITSPRENDVHSAVPGEYRSVLERPKPYSPPVMESSVSNLSLINLSLRHCAYDTESTQSSVGSCSIFSSSTDSGSCSETPSPPSIPRKYHKGFNSVPSSPCNATLHGRPQGSGPPGRHKISEYKRTVGPKKHQPSSTSTNQQRPMIKLTSREEVITAMRRLYGLPTTMPSTTTNVQTLYDKPVLAGPPKVKIIRREIKQPTQIEESSETTSNYSQPSSSRDGFHLRPLAGGSSQAKQTESVSDMRTRAGLTRQHARTAELSTPVSAAIAHREYPTIFFNAPISLSHYTMRNADGLFEVKDFAIIEKMAQLVDGLDSYTCHHGQCVLLHRLRPPFPNCIPILRSATLANHSHESSDLTSEFSAVLDRQRSSFCAPINGGNTGEGSSNGSPPGTSRLLALSKPVLPNGEGVRNGDGQGSNLTQELDTNEQGIIHTDTLYRLSDKVKIWCLYRAELTFSTLSLYSHGSAPRTPSAKLCIPIAEVRAFRKPSRLATSTTTGLSTEFPIVRHRLVKPYAESVPVTRKLAGILSPHDARTNYGHFELVMASGKTYKFRGKTSAETETWVTQIRRVIRAGFACDILSRHGAQLVMQGWLRRIKRSEACWLWCRLLGHYLVYTQCSNSRIPSGFKSLQGIHIRTVTNAIASEHANWPIPLSPESDNQTKSDLTSSSDSDILTTGDLEQRNRTIALWSDKLDPVYLVCRTDEEFEQWRDHLIRACQPLTLTTDAAIDLSKLRARMNELWRLLVCTAHANASHHTDEPIKQPLSRTTDKAHVDLSVTIFACLLFLSYPQVVYKQPGKSATTIPIHMLLHSSFWLNKKYTILKFLAENCYTNPEVKDELFLQIIKQLMLTDSQIKRLARRGFLQRSEKPVRVISLFCSDGRTRGGIPDITVERIRASAATESGSDRDVFELSPSQHQRLGTANKLLSDESRLVFPASSVLSPPRPECWWPVLAIWECLGILLALFLPSTPVLKCLDLVLTFYTKAVGSEDHNEPDILREISRYAAFCHDALRQTLNFGGRTQIASAFEVASISIRNPYTHKYPFSIPIRLPDKSIYEVISFNGGSDLGHIMQQIVQKLNLPLFGPGCAFQYAMYLCLSGESKPNRYLYLRPNWKICDILSLYERAILDLHAADSYKLALEQVTAELTFRIQAFSWKRLRKMSKIQVEPAITFLIHQLHNDIMAGNYAVTTTVHELTDLIAHLCRVNHQTYTELQRRKEFTLSHLIQSYYPEKVLSQLSTDGRVAIQLKLHLLDRWSLISKANQPSHSRSSETVNGDLLGQTNDRVQASFAYLRLLRRLSPVRFGTTSFPAYVQNLPGLLNDQLVWLVPQELQLNIFAMTCDSDVPSGRLNKPLISCHATIPYARVQSFGGYCAGAFYIIYFEKSTPFREQSKSGARDYSSAKKSHSRRTERSPANYSAHRQSPRKETAEMLSIRNLRIYLTDLNAVIELTETLNFFLSLSTSSQQNEAYKSITPNR